MLKHSMIQSICVIVKSLTLQEAIAILRSVNQSYLVRTLYVETQVGDCREFQFESLGDDARNLCSHLTSFWKVWYVCGPPCNREWVEGTLCQFVADCLLLEVVEWGEKTISDLVGTVLKVGAP